MDTVKERWDLWFGAREPVSVPSPGPDVCHCARQCVFGVFTPKMTWIMVVPRDQTVHEVTVYYVNEYLPYLLDQKIQVPANISLALYLKH